MPYRIAVFDFDGTLADSLPWFLRNVDEAADRYGFRRMEPDEVDTLRGWDARRIVRHLRVPMWRMPQVAAFMRRRMAEEIDQVSLFAGIGEALERLAERGVGLCVLSSNAEANVRRVLGPRYAARIHRYQCGASLFGKRAGLRVLLRELDVPAAQVICVGDEIRDLHAARAEGIPFGAVAWGYTRVESLRALGPEEVFDRVEELADRIAPVRPREGASGAVGVE